MKKVLIVEDEAYIRDLYSEVLRESNFEVFEAKDGREGYNLALAGDWDVLLLDIMLPSLDGVSLLKELSLKFDLSQKPVIVVTNLEEEKIKHQCLGFGVKEYLVKSDIIPEDLVDKVNTYVQTPESKTV